MKIYTSYFAKTRKIPKDYKLISVAGKAPGYASTMARYTPLMPKYEWWKEWHDNHLSNEWYTEMYHKTVLDVIKPDEVVRDLENISEGKDVVLLCWESPEKFCHRHLIADWLNKAGYDVVEWESA